MTMGRYKGPCRLGAMLVACCLSPALPAQEALPAAAAWQRLQDGNARFVADRPAKKDIGRQRRAQLAKGQHPFAVVLACADSRVAPEILFDQGLGDLFVVRVAGNVTDPVVLGSIEYAVEHLQTPLVVVLGHEDCGAVQAALAGKKPEGNLGQLIRRVHVGDKMPQDKKAALEVGVRHNTAYQARQLARESKVLHDLVSRKRLRIVAGVYSLQTGAVQWLEPSETKKPPATAGHGH